MISEQKLNYYTLAFKKLDNTGENTFNFAACIFGPFWLAYRKMYVESMIFSALLSGLWLPISASSFLYNGSSVVGIVISSLFILGLIWTVLGFYGNRIYRYFVSRQISNGYHLMPEYRTTSVLSALFAIIQPLYLLADIYENLKWQENYKFKEEDKAYSEENIAKYLKNDTENHFYGKLAVLCGIFTIVFSAIMMFVGPLAFLHKKATVKNKFTSMVQQINKSGLNDKNIKTIKIDD